MNGKKKVHGLKYTPGKLLTGKGPIPGDLGAFGDVWGKFNVTGDQAERMMGFRPKKGAIGVVLSRRKYIDKNGKVKKGIFASSLMPHKIPDTKGQKATNEQMKVIGHIAHKHCNDLIAPIWNPLIKDDTKKPYTGYHYFMGTNLKHVGSALNWKNLLISKGPLKPPKRVCPNWFNPDTQEIKILLPLTINYQPLTINGIGIGIFDIITGSFLHIAPEQITGFDNLPDGSQESNPYKLIWKLENIRKNYKPKGLTSYKYYSRFYIYIYYRKPNLTLNSKLSTPNFLYSPSTSRRIESHKYKEKEEKIHSLGKSKKLIIIKIE